jgi:hypothetical protein
LFDGLEWLLILETHGSFYFLVGIDVNG